jgi:hypothetical protein
MSQTEDAKQAARSLFLNSATDYTITDGDGNIVPLSAARELWEAHGVKGWNIALERLALQFDWDIEAVKAYYTAADKRWFHAKRRTK